MNIDEVPSIRDWLSQFDQNLPDRYLASYLLKKMRYVSFEEMEAWLQDSLSSLIDEIVKNDGRKVSIAIFPVAKPFLNQFNQDKEIKAPNDSSGRIAHALKNLERRLPSHVEVTPREESMRQRKVKHIIFVDDFVGTGDRFIKSWRSSVSRRIKSWSSFGWCKIWFVSFAGHKTGIRHVLNQVKALDSGRVRVAHIVEKSFLWDNRRLAELCFRYGERLSKSKARLGYGKLLSPFVFQHGCPNNVPGIFWSNGKSNKWRPLFPERSITTELYPLFSTDMSRDTTPEELWIVGHYKLAVQIVDEMDRYHGNHQDIMILGYLKKKKDIKKIQTVLVLSDKEFEQKIKRLIDYGLVDENVQLTRFGEDVLLRSMKTPKFKKGDLSEYKNFFPSTFLGFQREV